MAFLVGIEPTLSTSHMVINHVPVNAFTGKLIAVLSMGKMHLSTSHFKNKFQRKSRVE
jgi:hypothetical protein